MMLVRRAVQRSSALQSRGLATTLLSRPKEEWTLNELKSEARKRGLFHSGSKATLLARLQADEASVSTKPTEPKPSASQTVKPRFQSARTIHNSPSRKATEVEPSKFSPRRSAPLNIKMPDLDYELPEPGPTIPLVPDNWDATPCESASPPPPEPSNEPKVMTVASGNTHIGGGPSHPSADLSEKPVDETPSTWQKTISQWSQSLGGVVSSVASAPSSGSAPGSAESSPDIDPKAELEPEEKRGLYVLGGILLGGYLLGGVGKKSKEPEAEHH